MTEFAFMESFIAAGIGVLIGAYVIFGVLLALGIFALCRLAVLSKRLRDRKEESPEEKDCESCEKLKEKDQEIADLKEKVKDLESRPAPVVAVLNEERTLSESLAAASATGKNDMISKKSIIAYLSDKYGDAVELNGRANRTPNGKLLLSDNHFAFAPDGKRVCFVYVYETDEGSVLSLIRLDEPYVCDLLSDHPAVRRSAFPKNKAKDWYSVVADDTFTAESYYAVLDHAIALIRGSASAAKAIPEPVAEEPQEISLSESLAAAKEKGAIGLVTKKTIIAHLAETFGEKVELNGRANRTPNGKLLMSDNHFAFAPDGKRVCFTYIYEDDDGRITILLRTTAAHATDIRAAHPSTGARSAFPKNKERDWYSVVVDDSFTEAGVYAELDRAAMNIIGAEITPAPIAEEPQEISLSESLAAAKEKGAIGLITKKTIIAHLAETFGEKVELNGRANRTPNGKLLMSDNHFAFAPDGKRVCFTYIYEDDDGRITILLRTTAAHATDIRAAHPSTGARSAFPKNKERDWYSVVVDDSFTEAGVYAELDRAAMNIIGTEAAPAPVAEEPVRESVAEAQRTEEGTDTAEKEIAATLAETVVTEEAKEEDQAQPAEPSESEKEEPAAPEAEPEPEPLPPERKEELSLNETLDAAKTSGAIGIVTKKSIFNHLAGEFEDRVELNGRENITENKVRILIADTHFAFNPKGKKICFTYVYEDDDGKVAILLRTTAEHAADIRAAHPATGARCLFPKNKDGDWYGIVVDNTFTEKQVYADLDRAVRYILEGIPTAAPIADQESPAEEISLKESLASAKESGVVGLTTKKSIIDYLTGKYGDNVEVNGRENRTPNGKLLLSDNHFALAEGKRVCFTYVYEDEGRITILLRLDASSAKAIRSAHHATGLRSAFPKNKDKDWYSVVVDDTFSKGDLQEILDESITYVLTK